MGAYLYTISIENVSREIRTQTLLALEKSTDEMDAAFRNMDVLAGQVVAIQSVSQVANKTPDDDDFIIDAFNAKEELSVLAFTESVLPVKAFVVYFEQNDFTLSYSEFNDVEIHYFGRNYYRDTFDKWYALLKNKEFNRQFIPLDSFKAYEDSTYMYKLPLNEYTLKNIPATLFFEIDFLQIQSIFSDLNLYDKGSIIAMNGNDHIAFTINSPNVSDVNALELIDLNYTNNMASIDHMDGTMFVTKAPSNFNGWTYYLIQPADAALYSLTQYRNIFIIIILVGVFLEIILILFLSRSNVIKITQLGNELQDTLTLHEDLQKVVDIQKPLIKQSYLRKIIRGNIATEMELDYARQYIDIDTADKKFSVLYITAYMNQYELHIENSTITGPEDINYNEVILGYLEAVFGADSLFFSPRPGEYAILLSNNLDEPDDKLNKNASDAFSKFHLELKDNYSIWTLAGLGDWNPGLMITWKSYQQAMEAISYATKRDIFKCYARIEKNTAGFYYPIELTNQLTNFITTGNKSQVLEIFEIIRHENMEERSLPLNIMKYLLSDVRNTLYKIRFTIKETDTNEANINTIDDLFNQPASLKLCEDIAIALCELFDANSSNNQLINTIRTYIDENYKDPSMSLTKISDEFSISESYFSYLFKEEIGENFSSYLAKTRIEQAYKLIKETDINLSEIYNEVGYNNSHSFRRVFKKIYGYTPKEVRSQLRNG